MNEEIIQKLSELSLEVALLRADVIDVKRKVNSADASLGAIASEVKPIIDKITSNPLMRGLLG